MRKGPIAFLAVVVVGVIGLVVVQLSQSTKLAFTLGAAPQAGLAKMKRGQTICQRSINVPPDAGFDRIALQVGTNHRPGPQLDVVVRGPDGRRLATGTLPAGYPDVPEHGGYRVVKTAAVAGDQPIDVCVTNHGRHSVALYGSGALANRNSDATLDGKPTQYDVALVFQDARRSRAGQIGHAFARASLFRPGFVGTWTYWLLGLLLVLAVPALLWRAVAVADEPTDPRPAPDRG
jgi:hypothetical protein